MGHYKKKGTGALLKIQANLNDTTLTVKSLKNLILIVADVVKESKNTTMKTGSYE